MRRLQKDARGFTLVELIVTFALTALLFAAAAAMLPTYLRVYARIEEQLLASTLGDTLVETVTSELAGAADSRLPNDDSKNLRVSADGTKVSYRNSEGYPMEMYAENGRLVLHYLAVKDSNDVTMRPEVFWGYEDGAYTNNRITALTFSCRRGSNLVDLTIGLENVRTGYAYTVTRTIRCYNLTNADMA